MSKIIIIIIPGISTAVFTHQSNASFVAFAFAVLRCCDCDDDDVDLTLRGRRNNVNGYFNPVVAGGKGRNIII